MGTRSTPGALPARRGCLFIVSGPSGAGKTSICTPALAVLQQIELSVSTTTRSPRTTEREGVDYRFVSDGEFATMVARDAFAEWAEVHGKRYGTSRGALETRLAAGHDVLLDIDVQGARQIKAAYPDAVAIFLVPPSPEHIEQRLSARGTDSDETVKRRLSNACAEIARLPGYDYFIVNDDLEEAKDAFLAIVKAERQRTSRHVDASLEAFVRSFEQQS